ncbi:MAG: hypothetical protein ABDH25_04505 [Dictyoglomaceae bacterium]
MKIKLIILLTLVFLLIPVYALALETYYSPIFSLAKDPRALGVAGAMTALGDSPTSAIFNPALMGEYNSFSLKVGLGFWPVDETVWNNFNKIMEYIDIMGQEEPPDDYLSAETFLTGYANLGIGRLGLTLWADANFDVEYYKYTDYQPEDPDDSVIQGNIGFSAPINLNGALTLGLPVINLGNMKLNIGANLRMNVFGVEHQYVNTQVNLAGLWYSQSNEEPAYGYYSSEYYAYNYLHRGKNESNIRNWAIDLGAWLKLSDNFALGISAQNVYAQWIGGEYYQESEEGYFTANYENGNITGVNYNVYSSYSESGSITPEEIELEFEIPLTLKAGALLKLPVLSTRIAFDANLDKNFQPTLYSLGIEQPLLFFVLRCGAILDPNFQPLNYTIGAGVNLLFLRVDVGLGYQAVGSFMETIQNTMPLVASFSGSIQF